MKNCTSTPIFNNIKTLIIITTLLLFCTVNADASTQDRIIFFHIPKSGGVSVSSLLMNEYDLSQISNPNPENICLYSYGTHSSLFTIQKNLEISKFKFITFLRNPIDRILSEHRYCIRKHNANPDILIAHNLPPEGDPIETASNNMCKSLSGLDDKNPLIPIEAHLESAKNTLKDKFFFLGITEKMEESIHLLYSKLGWKIPEEIPHFNKTEDITFPPDVLQKIAERNWADIELYEYVLGLYDIQKNQISISSTPPSDEEINFVTQCLYTFDQKLKNGYGWGFRELFDAESVYRWAIETNEAGIDFHLQPDWDYTIQCTMLIQPIFHNQLHLFVNGIEVPFQSIDCANDKSMEYRFSTYQANIPKNLITKGEKTRIVFKMTSPEDPLLYAIFKEDHPFQSINMNYLIGKFGLKEIRISQISREA